MEAHTRHAIAGKYISWPFKAPQNVPGHFQISCFENAAAVIQTAKGRCVDFFFHRKAEEQVLSGYTVVSLRVWLFKPLRILLQRERKKGTFEDTDDIHNAAAGSCDDFYFHRKAEKQELTEYTAGLGFGLLYVQ